MLFPDLTARDRQPEVMDDPGLHTGAHRSALRGLARLNTASRIVPTVWRELLTALGDQPASIIDVAAGSGDLVVSLASRARARGLSWRFAACDISSTACETTRERAEAAGVEIETGVVDALAGEIPGGHDLVMCHLFLHHLDGPEIETLLSGMRNAAGRGVLATDLVRSRRGYALAWLASRVLTRSPVVHTDALLSVRGALTIEELGAHAETAGLKGARIRRVWPERMMLRCDA
jgi:2-polyprenyl-3-methyl-5-hydroxy-6-metoxy-1,4-benzoquinol methylase